MLLLALVALTTSRVLPSMETVLHAVEQRNMQVLTPLLDNAEDRTTMLYTAAQLDLLDLLDIIFAAHPEDMNRADGVCPLVVAAFRGKTDTVRHLLARETEINTVQTVTGLNAVLAAASQDHCDTLLLLLGHDPDLNIRDQHVRLALLSHFIGPNSFRPRQGTVHRSS